MAPQHAPHLVVGHIAQRLGNQPPVPRRVALRRLLVEFGQDALLGGLGIDGRVARARPVEKARHALGAESPAPLGDSSFARSKALGDGVAPLALGGQ